MTNEHGCFLRFWILCALKKLINRWKNILHILFTTKSLIIHIEDY